MKTKLQTTKIFFIVLSLFVLGCILVSPKTTADPATAVGVTDMPPPTELANTATLPPTDVPTATATVYPPVFDPETLGDNRELDSFIRTRTDIVTGGSEVYERQDTIGYIKEPFNAFIVTKYSRSDWSTEKAYWIGGRSYKTNATVDWLINLEAGTEDYAYFLKVDADMRRGYITNADTSPISATFIGQEDFHGIPAYHFTFDQTNLSRYGIEPGDSGYITETAQGDIYLSQAGNYLLYFHVKATGNFYSVIEDAKVRELTEELSSINQLKEIAVPPEYLEPEQTLLDLDLPLPAGTTLVAMRRFGGASWETYAFAASVSNDEFLAFYENLAPTSGWTVSHIGQVTYHSPCSGQDQVCIIINKGDVQFILDYYEGSITADYDREHVFSPQ